MPGGEVRPFILVERNAVCTWHDHLALGGSFCVCTKSDLAYVQIIFFTRTVTLGVAWGG